MIIVINKHRPQPSAGLRPGGVRQSRQAARGAARGVLRAQARREMGMVINCINCTRSVLYIPISYSLFILYVQFVIIAYVDMIINRVNCIPYIL